MRTEDLNRITNDIWEEIDRQDAKWGVERNLEDTLWLTILMEEVGECAKAILEKNKENLREELVQVGALCMQIVERLDADEKSRRLQN